MAFLGVLILSFQDLISELKNIVEEEVFIGNFLIRWKGFFQQIQQSSKGKNDKKDHLDNETL
jgi:hypothetical protein